MHGQQLPSHLTNLVQVSLLTMQAADRGIGGEAWDYTDMRSQQLLSRLIEKFRAVPQPIIAAVQVWECIFPWKIKVQFSARKCMVQTWSGPGAVPQPFMLRRR